jgi:hypothetical protein
MGSGGGGSSGADAAKDSAGMDGSAGGGGGTGGRAGDCPSAIPSQGTPCSPAGTTCTWGDQPHRDCRTRGVCGADGRWNIIPPPSYCAGSAAGCLQAMPALYTTCQDQTLVCLYPEATRCRCLPCACPASGPPGPPCHRCRMDQPIGTPLWLCDGRGTFDPECPSVVPNDGTPCNVPETVACPRARCGSPFTVVCRNGRWRWEMDYTPPCPVCASPDTPIATPQGERRIADLREGDLVYSVDGNAIRPVIVARTGRTPVVNHSVIRVMTADGRRLEVSAGHPTADGRTFRELRPGARLDGQPIDRVEVVPYRYPETHDILPASDTGTYFASGMLIGSSLK